jgi:tRNA wybutosine-synthesizing protein 1
VRQALSEACGGEYGLACEHAHSCCLLLARKSRFLKSGHWHTWIDYERFQELASTAAPFASEDYLLPTPDWAVYGSPEAGFDPLESRVRKVRNHPSKAASGGCT